MQITNGHYYGNVPVSSFNRRNVENWQGSDVVDNVLTLTGKYSFEYIDVYVDGKKKVLNSEYVANDGKTVKFLNQTFHETDKIEVVIWIDSSLNNYLTFPKSEIILEAYEANQTVFKCPYNVGNIDLYVNSLRKIKSEYTAIDGETITLNDGVTIGTILNVVNYEYPFSTYNLNRKNDVFSITETQNELVVNYLPQRVAVYKNHLRLYPELDYTAENGSVILFTENLVNGDKILVESIGY